MSTGNATTSTQSAIDAEALRRKYREERDRRLRADGEAQYVEMAGKLARFAEEDPYIETVIDRAPSTEEVEVVIIGGGFSGMLAAARLREAGIKEIRIIEAGGDFGGTWYWNRYPGAQCDIDAYCYLPLLEELGYMPKEKYSYVTEIFEHCQRIGNAYGLYDITWFQTRVQALNWDEDIKRWHISTNRGDDIKARFVVTALGTASRAKLPGIPGIEDFEGHSFHTSRWDYDYTGGDTNGNLHKLADKRVAIIGTGATAIQAVPHLAANAGELFVFQRTPSSVDYRGNKPTDPEWVKSLQPGWQRERRQNFGDIVMGRPFSQDLVNDAWTDIFRNLVAVGVTNMMAGMDPAKVAEMAEMADFQKMNQIRARVDETVQNPDAAEALKPWYRQFCKRPTFNDQFLEAFNRPNVTLVDTSPSKGVQRLTKTGVVANDIEYPVDCVIFSTGFEISTAFKRRIGFEINGRDGQSLFDYWADGFKTLHGHSSHGFPNWFYIGISQNALSVNMTAMFDDQAQHIAYIIAQVKARGATTVEPTIPAQEQWVATIRKLSVSNEAFLNACTPGYYNNEGSTGGGLTGEVYAPGINAFNDLLAEWRAQGDLAGLHLGA